MYIHDLSLLMENQRVYTEKQYSQLINQTLSHELMTPLNCATNLSSLALDALDTILSTHGPVSRSLITKTYE